MRQVEQVTLANIMGENELARNKNATVISEHRQTSPQGEEEALYVSVVVVVVVTTVTKYKKEKEMDQ